VAALGTLSLNEASELAERIAESVEWGPLGRPIAIHGIPAPRQETPDVRERDDTETPLDPSDTTET
jgi:hypothetical protein